jgi:hypothetical protein
MSVPSKHLPRTSFSPSCRPPFISSQYPSRNERRSPVIHCLPLIGCADFPLSRPTRCHNLRKWVRYLVYADHSGPFGFWSLQGTPLPKALRRNSERSRPRGDAVAKHDVRNGCSCGSPFINRASIVLHIKSSIRYKKPSIYLENVKLCSVYGPFSPPLIPPC